MNLILICTYIASSFELLLSCQLVEFILYKSLKSEDTSLSVLLFVTSETLPYFVIIYSYTTPPLLSWLCVYTMYCIMHIMQETLLVQCSALLVRGSDPSRRKRIEQQGKVLYEILAVVT